MTAHQDVAGVVESLPERLRVNTCRFGYESEADATKRRIATDLEAASLIESLSKALSEAEAERDRWEIKWQRECTHKIAAESRLAEAMKVIEPFAACVFNDNGDMSVTASRAKFDDFAGAYIFLRAARRFLNAGKE